MRKLSPEKQQELDRIAATLRVIWDHWHAEAVPGSRETTGEFRRINEYCHATGDLRGLRMAYTDTLEMLGACSAAQRRSLDARLKTELGFGLDTLQARQVKRIQRIRGRGRISNEQQYYELRARVEEIWDDPERQQEFRELEELMNAYGNRVTKGRDRPRTV